ncbi:MAG: FG-GAP repeat protein [Planctomycetes bacterium]|nr:FG-GAP repeat protein [Planctomycetota bacterium]
MSPRLQIHERSVRCSWRAIFVAMCGIAFAGPGIAQAWGQWEQSHMLTVAGAADWDGLGLSVAIDGDIAIVGVPLDDDAGSNSGSAYLFDVTTGAQLHKLTADDGAAFDVFGVSVGISGGIVIVGARADDDAGESSGSAYLFDVTTGQQLHKLTAEDAAELDFFGNRVSISGDIAIVGATGDDDAGSGSGAAYLFDVATGEQLHKLTAADAAEEDRFGHSVAISGANAIVGSWHDDDAGDSSGSAYLFDVATGQQLHKLAADDGAPEDLFGDSVAISEGIAIVGARWDDDACSSDPLCDSGSAYLFDVTTGQQLHKLTAEDAAADESFGNSVAISGDIAILGVRRDDDACPSEPLCDSGSAYLFDVTTGQQLQKLTAEDAAANEWFGTSVAISGGLAIVGAPGNHDAGPGSGSAYVFEEVGLCDDEDGDSSVTICHFPPGNPENARTITVGVDAVPAHLAHGDHCGPCEEDDGLLMGGSSNADHDDCSADLDDSGGIGAADLAQILGAWGPNSNNPADLSGDGEVGPADLAILLGNWGPCP